MTAQSLIKEIKELEPTIKSFCYDGEQLVFIFSDNQNLFLEEIPPLSKLGQLAAFLKGVLEEEK